MLKHTNRRLQLYWWLMAGTVVIASLLPHANLSKNLLGAYFNWPWVHFLVYLGVSILPVLAWRLRTGLAMSLGMAVASVGLEILRGLVLYRSIRVQDIIVNLLGVAAGTLLGLNILTLRSGDSQVDPPGADVSRSSPL
jgi:glycopeptide antibiotics resistance protein